MCRSRTTTGLLTCGLSLASLLLSCAPPAPAAPRGVVLMIGDGMGFSQIAFARRMLLEEGERWSFERLPVSGIVSTFSASNATTDSGAAATAMSAGIKTANQRIGMSIAGEAVEALPETAIEAGWKVGYVTTTKLTHATPAAFYAHVRDRYDDEPEIAVQLVEHGASIALGGGRGAFLPKAAGGERTDGRDLLRQAEEFGWTVWTASGDLEGDLPERLLGVFAERHLTFRLDDLRYSEQQRAPSLARLTELALTVLSASGEPFFLMVEGGRIDQACHSFDGPTSAYEIEDFDGAVEVVARFRERNPEVLMLVTADHATGGLAINDYVDWEALRRQRASIEWMGEQIRNAGAGVTLVQEMTGFEDITEEDLDMVRNELDKYESWRNLGRLLAARNGVSWIPHVGLDTKGHTGEDVPIYTAGPGAERFQGVLDNTDIAHRLRELAGFG